MITNTTVIDHSSLKLKPHSRSHFC